MEVLTGSFLPAWGKIKKGQIDVCEFAGFYLFIIIFFAYFLGGEIFTVMWTTADDELFSGNLHLLLPADLLSQQQIPLYQLRSH